MTARDVHDYSRLVHEAWAIHQSFRRLGFSSDDIFVLISGNQLAPETGPWVFMSLRSQDKTFQIDVGPLGETAGESFLSDWREFAESFNARSFPDAAMHRIYDESFIRQNSVSFIDSLLSKGFVLPKAAARLKRMVS